MAGAPTSDHVTLLGLDVGSTTTALLVVEARVACNSATGRMELRDARIRARPHPVFTPFADRSIDLCRLGQQIEAWLESAGLNKGEVFSGGAIVTGLAAEKENADALGRLVTDLIGDAVIATADDPRLEAWLAFMGGSGALSRSMPEQPILNLDIGGGTTNPALGVAGEVLATGSYFIGARHFKFEPGSYRLTGLSPYGAALLDHLGLICRPGDVVPSATVSRVTDYFVEALAALVTRQTEFYSDALGRRLTQAEFRFPQACDPAVTFSGGVGELVYALADGADLPVTPYGDLGADVARGILGNARLSRDVQRIVPEHKGRATVQGLTLNNTEISGTTLFVQGADALPLRDLPVVATLKADAGEAAFVTAMRLAGRVNRGACVQLAWEGPHPASGDVKRVGLALGSALSNVELAEGAVLVVLTTANVGKALGNYATGWGSSPHRLLIIDEIPARPAHFVNVGRLKNGVVPVSFYGLA